MQRFAAALFSLPLILSGCSDDPEPVTVQLACASSTGPLVEHLVEKYRLRSPAVEVDVNVAASSTLSRQILAGLAANLFVSADSRWVSMLSEEGLVDEELRAEFARNSLVLVRGLDVAEDFPLNDGWRTFPIKPGKVAVGDFEHVPCGMYARQALENLGVWERWRPGLVPALDARSALAMVATGSCPWGILYSSDAVTSSDVEVSLQIPDELHSPIVYSLVALRPGRLSEEARALFYFLTGPEVRDDIARFRLLAPDTLR